jgi:S-methylmethionine-dependent homocysteine/selenocysteine methylase
MYSIVADKLVNGKTIILDGGTGTEIQRQGAPMHGETWCAEVNLTHPHIVQAVHESYIEAGADVIIANTFATSPLLYNALGRDGDVARIDKAAVEIARRARNGRPIPIAGSFSTMRPVLRDSDRTLKQREWSQEDARPLMRRKAEALAEAGCDLIMMEMMRDLDYSLWATEAAVATGLPVWVGISVERRDDGVLAGFGRQDWLLADIVSPLMATGASVCSIMHTSPNHMDEAIDIVRANWAGPLGAYPESGYFKMPDWQFVDIIPPGELVNKARGWRKKGVSLLGGCCGIGPEHIRALAEALKKETV